MKSRAALKATLSPIGSGHNDVFSEFLRTILLCIEGCIWLILVVSRAVEKVKNESPCQKSITDTLGNVNNAKRFA